MDPKLEQARESFLQGVAHFEAGRLEPARAAFQTALDLAPGRASVLSNLGMTLFRLGRAHEAIPLLEQVTAIEAEDAAAWRCLALSHAALAQWKAAVDAQRNAIRLLPHEAGLLLSQGDYLLRLGQASEALQAFDRAVSIAPNNANAWTARGGLLRELQQLDAAALCFEKALSLGADTELTHYYLASVKGISTPPPPPRQYVESLFDDYAADFQSHVLSQLRYQGHECLVRPLLNTKRRFQHALDLGCGTGLCGPLIHPFVDAIDGIDLSHAMLEQARALGIYRTLIHADINSWLQTATCTPDLIIAADVFIYVGQLETIFGAVRKLLTRGGRFAFSVEEPTEGAHAAQDLQLLPSLRYAHSERYIRRLAETHGFKIDEIFRAPIRYDQAQAVAGMFVYLS